jgi:hypothetical protein
MKWLGLLLATLLCGVSLHAEKPKTNEPACLVRIASLTSMQLKRLFPEYEVQRVAQTLRPAADKKSYEGVAVGYRVHGPRTQEELREVLVAAVEIFREGINTNGEMKSHLNHFPLTDKDLQVVIQVVADDGDWCYSPHLTSAQMKAGDVTYSTIEFWSEKSSEMAQESYEVAFQTLQPEKIAS